MASPGETFQASFLVSNVDLNVLASGEDLPARFDEAVEAVVAAHVGDADRSKARYSVRSRQLLGPPLEGAEKTVVVRVALRGVKSESAARLMALKLQPPPPRLCDAIARRLQELQGLQVLRVQPWDPLAIAPPGTGEQGSFFSPPPR